MSDYPELTEQEEHALEMERWEGTYGKLADVIDSAYYNAKPAANDRELWLGMARIITATLVSADLKPEWQAILERYTPKPPVCPVYDDNYPF